MNEGDKIKLERAAALISEVARKDVSVCAADQREWDASVFSPAEYREALNERGRAIIEIRDERDRWRDRVTTLEAEVAAQHVRAMGIENVRNSNHARAEMLAAALSEARSIIETDPPPRIERALAVMDRALSIDRGDIVPT